MHIFGLWGEVAPLPEEANRTEGEHANCTYTVAGWIQPLTLAAAVLPIKGKDFIKEPLAHSPCDCCLVRDSFVSCVPEY